MNLIDLVINEVDKGLKYSTQNYQTECRPYPADKIEQDSLNEFERNHSAGLMRVNHSGEVCAQALYRGQALTAKLGDTRTKMEKAASEELDHLAWCNKRLEELNNKPSIFNPIWYGMSFSIGAVAGLIGDNWSLGFVHETEEQVVKHLDGHLDKLSNKDLKTRVVIEQMRIDEEQHSHDALKAGAEILPDEIKDLMSKVAEVMTNSSYHI
ncbi:MAG: 2-polyprenyl-3-methyl-6-methoxy-1,4-benzoquinone monooxygenase [Gammaproteobacteria bacterium]|nr:MAG: 2-polyprenyl-3-methyl-6-methoxy-1,4-benzoquinone monooxygenase [Gammaproteobacteria bacterium]